MKWNEFTKGCTILSFVFSKLGLPVIGEYCCDEHDVAYDQGGALMWKLEVDLKFFDCVEKAGGFGIALFRWVMITFSPYSYYVWFKAERGE